MKQVLSIITLGVDDLQLMKRFYKENFGWKALKDGDDIAFFQLNGILLALFPREELATDAGVSSESHGFKCFTLAICLNSEDAVNKTFDELKAKSVNIIKPPGRTFWGGYSGYIKDPENNLWEIAHNPYMDLDEKGNVITHH